MILKAVVDVIVDAGASASRTLLLELGIGRST